MKPIIQILAIELRNSFLFLKSFGMFHFSVIFFTNACLLWLLGKGVFKTRLNIYDEVFLQKYLTVFSRFDFLVFKRLKYLLN